MQPILTSRRWAFFLGLTLPILLLFIGCNRQPAPTPATSSVKVSDKRIVSFSPALTRMIADLGHIDQVVAAIPLDNAVPPGTPVVGDLFTINYEKLLTVHPTDILIQQTRSPIPDRLTKLAASHNWTIWTFKLEELDDITRALHPDENDLASSGTSAGVPPSGVPPSGVPSIGRVLNKPDAARNLASRLRDQLARLAQTTATASPPRVLVCVYGSSTFTAAAPGTFVDQMLTAAGGQNVLPASAILYPNLSHEQLLKLDPQIILDVSQSQSGAPLNLPKKLAGRVVSLKDPDALLPSSSMARMACKLATLIHPTLLEEINTIVNQQASL